FEFGEDSRLPVGAAEYDCVLSSQVLEHVPAPPSYLEEAHRVLRPGGTLLLSTHGLFEDHACPADYWRWTAYGLKKLVESAGFGVGTIRKLTTGPRATVFFAERTDYGSDYWRVARYYRAILFGLRGLRAISARRRHEACDICFPAHRVVDFGEAGHETYVALVLAARR
ncbi:MAG: class I SAM-dependent methyltransferase, partial [Stellaceae bacterium]